MLNEFWMELSENKNDGLSHLEIGAGAGDSLIPALKLSQQSSANKTIVKSVCIVEPSPMFTQCLTKLDSFELETISHNKTIQEFQTTRNDQDSRFDVAQACFCLHNLSPTQRAPILASLAQRDCRKLVVFEANVPIEDSEIMSRKHVEYVFEAYARGCQDMKDSLPVAFSGFLMPIMFKNFRADATDRIYEQSASAWRKELENAGFDEIEIKSVSSPEYYEYSC